MPVVNLQDQKVEILRKKYIAKVKSIGLPQAVAAQQINKVASMTKAQLVAELSEVAGQAPKSQAKAKSAKKQSSAQKTSAKARTSAKRRSAKGGRKTKGGVRRAIKIPELLRKRVGRIQRGIKAGTVAVKQGKAAPSAYPMVDARDRYEAFAALYKDARMTKKSRKSAKKSRKSIKAVFAQVQGQKYPYMLKKGYRVPARVVGGGARGAGIVRTIPGSKATPFNQLSEAEQAKVVAFLNSEKGKKLRDKGVSKKVVSLQAIKRQANAQAQRRKSLKSRKSQKGAANRR